MVPLIPPSNKVTVYLPAEDWTYILENYVAISKSDDALPWGKFFMQACLSAVSVVKPESNPDDVKLISELREEVITLKSSYKLNLEAANFETSEIIVQFNAMNEKLAEAEEKVISLQEQNTDLTDKLNAVPEILPVVETEVESNCVEITLSPKSIAVINDICVAESERTKTEVTPELLFKNVFFHVVRYGPHDMFKAPISLQRIRQIADSIQ